MAGEWREMNLGEAVELKRGYDLPSRERRDGPFPIVSSSGISGRHAEAKAKAPGVIIGRYGTLGEVYYITEDYWPLNTALYVRDFKGNDPRFISYFLRTLDFAAYSDKAAVPGLNRNDLHTAQIVLPPFAEQRAIAHILGTLDDKIELNRKMAATLEAMARALFKAWFVDFEPVRAKMEGRDPGLPEPLTDLFPSRLVETEEGEIPEEWRLGNVGDIAENPRHAARPSDIPVGTAYIALEHMPRRSLALDQWAEADGVESNKYWFERSDVLFGKLRPYFHKVCIAPLDGVCSTDIVVLRPKSREYWSYLALIASSVEFVAFTDQSSTGTKMPRTNWSDMSRYDIVLAPPQVLNAFDRVVRPLLDKIAMSVHESRALAALRDALLPKLVSGELRVKDAKKFLERAV